MEYGRLSFMVTVVEKSLVRDIALNRKTKTDRAMKPTPFKSIFDQNYVPCIISGILEGSRVENISSSATLLFSDYQKV